jgi:hypothetical protein
MISGTMIGATCSFRPIRNENKKKCIPLSLPLAKSGDLDAPFLRVI